RKRWQQRRLTWRWSGPATSSRGVDRFTVVPPTAQRLVVRPMHVSENVSPEHESPRGGAMSLDWKWIGWQVILPIVGPSLVAAIVSLAWMSLDEHFAIKMGVVLDIPPWAATFYSITLVAMAMDSLWTKLLAGAATNPKAPSRFLALLFVSVAVVVYNAFFV